LVLYGQRNQPHSRTARARSRRRSLPWAKHQACSRYSRQRGGGIRGTPQTTSCSPSQVVTPASFPRGEHPASRSAGEMPGPMSNSGTMQPPRAHARGDPDLEFCNRIRLRRDGGSYYRRSDLLPEAPLGRGVWGVAGEMGGDREPPSAAAASPQHNQRSIGPDGRAYRKRRTIRQAPPLGARLTVAVQRQVVETDVGRERAESPARKGLVPTITSGSSTTGTTALPSSPRAGGPGAAGQDQPRRVLRGRAAGGGGSSPTSKPPAAAQALAEPRSN